MDVESRLRAFTEAMPEDMDGALVTSPVNRRYFTGFPSSAGTLLILRGEAYFLTDSRYEEAARAAIRHCAVLLRENIYEQIAGLCKKHGAKTLGVESQTLSLSEFRLWSEALPGLLFLQDGRVSAQADRQRAVKSREEISRIAQAQRITDDAFAYILNYIKPGRTEREIALELEFYTRKAGSEGTPFAFIVVGGRNSSMPHGVPGDTPVAHGDFVTLDFGCVVEGYCSDMTRTVAVGNADERQRALYNTVLNAQLAALDAIRPGKDCREIDKIARDIIDAGPFKGCFGHGLGHSLGLDVHEDPRFNTQSEAVLEVGNVMSVEPGIYLPGEFGARIEDIVAITENGCRNFTTSPKELLVL